VLVELSKLGSGGEVMGTLLPFPHDDEMAAPPAVTTRQLCRLLVEEFRRKRTEPEPADFQTDVSGNPSETFDWRHYRAVMEARKREL